MRDWRMDVLLEKLGYDGTTEAEREDLEIDLSSSGSMNTMFATFFRRLLVSASVLKEAINGTVPALPLALGKPASRKVDKQYAHVYSVRITSKEA
nr:hypothetical protein [Tanacetum cinerariifolium]